jgi:hypothetical protein
MGSAVLSPKRMTVPQIRERAKELGINPGKMKKAELIHAIQVAEHCTPCYGLSDGHCPWVQCCWRSDCYKTKT